MKSFIALTLAWSISNCDAIKIDASGIAPPVKALGQYQTLEKTWDVSGDSGLHNLLVQAPGIVFIDYDASLADSLIAKFVLSGDSEDLINAFNVVSWNEHEADGVELRFKFAKGGNYRGHLFTQVLVGDKQVLQNLKSVSSADVVIHDDVLTNNDASASLEIGVFGSGDVTVKSTQKLTLGTFSVTTSGSGDIEVSAPLIDVSESISVNVVGSGDVALVAKEITVQDLEIKSIGSGDIYVQSDNVDAKNIDTVSMGSSDVNFSRKGKCVKHTIKVSGSGNVAAGSIVSDSTEVDVFGSGDALVQATEKLVATISGSGSVKYVGVAPKEVVVTGRSSHRGHHKSHEQKVKQARHNKYDTYVEGAERHRSPKFVTIRDKKHVFIIEDDAWDWSDDDDDIVVDEHGYLSNFEASLPSAEDLSTPEIAGIGVIMGFVALATRKYNGVEPLFKGLAKQFGVALKFAKSLFGELKLLYSDLRTFVRTFRSA